MNPAIVKVTIAVKSSIAAQREPFYAWLVSGHSAREEVTAGDAPDHPAYVVTEFTNPLIRRLAKPRLNAAKLRHHAANAIQPANSDFLFLAHALKPLLPCM